MSGRRIVRCRAKTAHGKQCKYRGADGALYCRIHKDCAINIEITQSAAITTPFCAEIWEHIGSQSAIGVKTIRSLILSCKNLYALFANDQWFVRFPRYIIATNHWDDYLSNSREEAESGALPFNSPFRCFSFGIFPSIIYDDGTPGGMRDVVFNTKPLHDLSMVDSNQIFYVVNSYKTFCRLFKQCEDNSIQLDVCDRDCKQRIYDFALELFIDYHVGKNVLIIQHLTALQRPPHYIYPIEDCGNLQDNLVIIQEIIKRIRELYPVRCEIYASVLIMSIVEDNPLVL